MHIVELQRKLMEAKGNVPVVSKYRMRTAAVQRDVNELLQARVGANEVSGLLRVPLSVVEAEKARIEKYQAMKNKYLATMKMEFPDKAEMAHFTIYQR
jgi:hypothetical protein